MTADFKAIVHNLLFDAVRHGASDIHFDPQGAKTRVRFRMDGSLLTVAEIESGTYREMEYYLKSIAGISGIERAPRSGRIDMEHRGKTYSFRCETAYNYVHDGSKITLRFISEKAVRMQLEDLGFNEQDLTALKAALFKHNGIILVSGPTGSGKTTTLYAAVNFLNHPTVHVMSVEDPVECPMPGVNQLEIKEQIRFAEILRSAMRHDPDIIMIGEIRDPETAKVAVRAALSGHLVLTTIHANSALVTVNKLVDFGVDPYNLVFSLRALFSQRLLKRLCMRCRCNIPTPPVVRLGIERAKLDPPDDVYEAGPGCSQCVNGYKGRIMTYELYCLDEDDQEMIYCAVRNGDNVEKLRPALKEKYGSPGLAERVVKLSQEGLISGLDAVKYI
jgi:type IV pilus assembly protein PilB